MGADWSPGGSWTGILALAYDNEPFQKSETNKIKININIKKYRKKRQ